MIKRIGFACVMHGRKLSTNHTFRLASLSPDRLTQAVSRNLDDLESMLAWMEPSGLRLLRLGSSLVPFASHEVMAFDWEPLCAEGLHRIGARWAAQGFRFSLHPGQYNVLNSTSEDVRRRTVRELVYSCRVLDLMGLDASHKVVLHGGSGGADAARRLLQAVEALPDGVRARLVLENDERAFTFADIVSVCGATGLPPVFDLHHHRLNPSQDLPELLERAGVIWSRDARHGRPKVHLSSQRSGARPGAHADLVVEADALELCRVLPFDADCMVEAKHKEAAALRIAPVLYGCRPDAR